MDWQLLASITEEERRLFLSSARRRSFRRNEVVMHEGDPADTLHLIDSGRLAVRVSTPAGELVTLNLLSPGDYFGELALLRGGASDRRRSATVIALEPAQTWSITETAFNDLRDRHPSMEHVLTAMLAQRIEELSGRLLETLYVGMDRRVYRRLSELATIYAEDDVPVTVVPLTQDHLAEMVGGTRQSVNQALQRLAAEGVVELGRSKILVHDHRALRLRAAT